jgi:CheY-like chemotaxis protein
MLKGHELTEARFGLEALGAIDEAPVDLIICDAALMDMSPNEFYRRLEDGGFSGKVLFLGPQMEAGPRDHLGRHLPLVYKPVDAEFLLQRVEELLAQPLQQWEVK